MPKPTYYVYILTNAKGGRLYTGVTNDINHRMQEHRDGLGSTFTKRYKLNRLIYMEEFEYVDQAIEMEKKIKGWTRSKKLALARTKNYLDDEIEFPPTDIQYSLPISIFDFNGQ